MPLCLVNFVIIRAEPAPVKNNCKKQPLPHVFFAQSNQLGKHVQKMAANLRFTKSHQLYNLGIEILSIIISHNTEVLGLPKIYLVTQTCDYIDTMPETNKGTGLRLVRHRFGSHFSLKRTMTEGPWSHTTQRGPQRQ